MIPLDDDPKVPAGFNHAATAAGEDGRLPGLLVETNRQARITIENFMRGTEVRAISARSTRDADEIWPGMPVALRNIPIRRN